MNKDFLKEKEDDESEGSGTGGQTGEIKFRFHDPMMGPMRDDLLPASEINRLLSVLSDHNQVSIKKGKDKREYYNQLKEGKVPNQYELGGMANHREPHPLLSEKLRGIRDQQVTSIPQDYKADTNEELKDRLENRLENRLQLKNAPKFNPKPRPM